MKKALVRLSVLEQLKNQTKHDKSCKDKLLFEDLITSDSYQKAKTIATYLSFDFEYDTQLLIHQAQKDGKMILIPKTYPQGIMVFCPYNQDNLLQTTFGLWEPVVADKIDKSNIDLIHVPGLAFNKDGFRIGYGMGYYDRYLADYNGDTVSTIYEFQKKEFQPDSHDITVQEIFSR